MWEPGTEASRAEIERDLELVRSVSRRFRTTHREDLEAELAATLIEVKERHPTGIRDWNAYLRKCLFNRAGSLVKKWRARQRRETSMELHPETVEVPGPEQSDPEPESSPEFARIRSKLDAASYALLELLAAAKGNRSRVARFLGVHRNTIGRRLQAIRRRLKCPIENVSGLPVLSHRAMVTRAADSISTQSRVAFRARLVFALDSGVSYTKVEQEFQTTTSTISRWKHRFDEQGLEGLKSKHQGRAPQKDLRRRLTNWLRTRQQSGKEEVSCRKIARELGMSKSTVHRLLRAGQW